MSDAADLVMREAEPRDAKRLHEIEEACFSDAWPLETFVQLCAGEGMDCWVAEVGGELAGYWVGRRIDDEAELANIAVAPAHQGRGVGKRLLEDFIDAAGGLDSTVLFLEVRASNLTAIALYHRYGFTEVGRRAKYYSDPVEDALVMRRDPKPAA